MNGWLTRHHFAHYKQFAGETGLGSGKVALCLRFAFVITAWHAAGGLGGGVRVRSDGATLEISGRHHILGKHYRCQLGVPRASHLTACIPATWNTPPTPYLAWCEVAEPVCVTARTHPPGSSCPDLSVCSTVGRTRVLCPPPPPALETSNELE